MAFYSGSQGQLLIDGVAAARVQGWSVSTSLGLLDTTSLEDTDRTSTPGVRSTTGSCTLFYYAPDPGEQGRNDASALINKLNQEQPGRSTPRAGQRKRGRHAALAGGGRQHHRQVP